MILKKVSVKLFISLLCLTFYDAGAQFPNYQWAFNIGGAEGDEGYSVQTDASHNVYIAGIFKCTADFDPSAGTANLTAPNCLPPFSAHDNFIAKYDSSGNYLWAFNLSNTVDADGT